MESDEVKAYYAGEVEKDRLELEIFKLEGIRTKEIIGRYLRKAPMNILDVGGGAGYYSFWLKAAGHRVSLVDLSPRNIELAKEREKRENLRLDLIETGDATKLQLEDSRYDLVLMLGPLYHLTKRGDRIRAIAEARRVVKPGGVVLMAVISRYASLIDGFRRDLVLDQRFEDLLIDDLKTGIHINRTDNPEYFTTAYFHTPAEIRNEILEAGLAMEKMIAIESFGAIISNFSLHAESDRYMKTLATIMRLVDENEDLLAMSPHIMAVAKN